MTITRRVPVDRGTLSGPGTLALPKDALHHVATVLRLTPGASLVLFDGEGMRANATLLDGGRVEVHAVEHVPALPAPRVTLMCGLSKGDKLELILEKACEAGAAAVWPVETARSVVRLSEERAGSKLERWQRLAMAASRQCGRDHVMQVLAPCALKDALPRLTAQHRRVLVVGEPAVLSGTLPVDADDVVLLTGPEGGLAPEEVAACVAQGFVPAGLGALTLRAETAPLMALAAVLTRAGRM
jgi:16S rRNA (uracil1498-N3)-methyltransferase